MTDASETPRLKLEGALRHLDNLKEAIERWEESHPYDSTYEFDAKSSEYVMTVTLATEPDPLIALIAGDCIHNLRASLEHVVWAIAAKNRKRIPNQTGFPIFRNHDDFICRGKPMIAALPEDARALIESMQPYQSANPDKNYLAVLHSLWNTEKHRHIPTVGFFAKIDHVIVDRGDPADILGKREIRREPNEVVLAVRVREGSDIQLQPAVPIGVAFGKRCGAKEAEGKPLFETLAHIHQVIRYRVFPAFAPFLAEDGPVSTPGHVSPSKG